jgi:hypothetical protein
MSQWYCQLEGRVVGPVSLEELQGIAERGDISPDSLVREGPEGPWIAASQVEDLSLAAGGHPSDQLRVLLSEDEGDQPAAAGDQQASDAEAVHAAAPDVRRSPLALRPCSDCGQMVSQRASVCPHCGRSFHSSFLAIPYRGEHPIPVLVFFIALALVFALATPLAVFFLADQFFREFMSEQAATLHLPFLACAAYAFSMVCCAVLGGAVGKPRMAYLTGLFLGLFFGPLGVFAAFAVDKRPQCLLCCCRLDGLAKECPCCHSRLRWEFEPSWY